MIRSFLQESAPLGSLQPDTQVEQSADPLPGSKTCVALIVLTVITFLSVSALAVVFFYYCHIRCKVKKKCRSQSQRINTANLPDFSQERVSEINLEKTGSQTFTYKQLQTATSNFSQGNVVGHGGFGSVYRGVLGDGRVAAIKQLDRGSKQGDHEFQIEVDMLSRLHSPYLVGLIGYCADQDHRLLVYEFMPNGNLQEHIYSDGTSGNPPILDWDTRMRVALDSARGLEYLHECVTPPIIHRDFKSSNILLDSNFNAKVADFGLAKLGSDKVGGLVSTRVLGTHGYVAPEYALTGHLTTKSDVYSYGVVLLELLTGRVPVDMKRPPGQGVLVSWALPRLTDRNKLVEMVDPVIAGRFPVKDLIQVAAIAAMCVQSEADYRPLMTDVVQSLIPLVKHKKGSKIVSTPNFHHRMVTLKSSSIDSGSSGGGDL